MNPKAEGHAATMAAHAATDVGANRQAKRAWRMRARQIGPRTLAALAQGERRQRVALRAAGLAGACGQAHAGCLTGKQIVRCVP